jgi:hypothetical protein
MAFLYNQLVSLDFKGCTSLTSIGDFVFQDNQLVSLDFKGCTSLVSIGYLTFSNNQLTNIDFEGCSSLTTIFSSAFSDNQITSVNFEGCTLLTAIYGGAFIRNQIYSIDLTDSTSLTTISYEVFYDNNITTIRLPSSVTSIAERAFGSNSITSVCYEAGVGDVSLGSDAFDDFDTSLITTCIGYPTSEPTLSPSVITTIAGSGEDGYSGDNEPATSADINGPTGIATDDYGNIYFSDGNNNRVRVVNSYGIIYTIAGNGEYGSSSDYNIAATSAPLAYPAGVALHNTTEGNSYISLS